MDYDPKIDYYGTLGLKKFASKDEVKKKYLELVRLYHPDRNPDADQNKFKNMTAAYTVLSNAKTKHQYDNARGGGSSWTSDHATPKDSSYKGTGNNQRNSSYYQRNYDSTNDYNRTGSYSSFYGKYYNARDQYQNNQKQQYSEEAKKSYEKWQTDRQKQRQQQEYEYQQAKQGKFYQDYDAFRRDYERKFSERDANYKQNFSNSDYYTNAKDNYDNEWSSMRGQRSYNPNMGQFNSISTRIIAFIF
jgi:curved DNA-binding protein CbpA